MIFDFDVVVVGGGAAGFFSAIQVKNTNKKKKVALFEKGNQFLSKVKISGGGRCNVTNNTYEIDELARNYPRGEKQLRKAFHQFNAKDTVEWFESRGVRLKVYPDNCIFPLANDSQVIIDCFLKESIASEIVLKSKCAIRSIQVLDKGFELLTDAGKVTCEQVIVTIGGQPKISGLKQYQELGLKIISPVPSLFTFNMPNNPIRELMGNVVEEVTVKIEGTKLTGKGPLLITHWGMSGPAILQLSAWGARLLEERNYQFKLFVNWLNECKEEELRLLLKKQIEQQHEKMLVNANPFPITNKLWHFLLNKHQLPSNLRWKELQGRLLNKLITLLLFDTYEVSGKTTFKEEFVTAGGIDLSEINLQTMESKKHEGLYFAGEVLDIDGITGGFNFQAAWTTGYIAGTAAAKKKEN